MFVSLWLAIPHLQALDLLLDKMKRAGLDFSRVRALSGSGQVMVKVRLWHKCPIICEAWTGRVLQYEQKYVDTWTGVTLCLLTCCLHSCWGKQEVQTVCAVSWSTVQSSPGAIWTYSNVLKSPKIHISKPFDVLRCKFKVNSLFNTRRTRSVRILLITAQMSY